MQCVCGVKSNCQEVLEYIRNILGCIVESFSNPPLISFIYLKSTVIATYSTSSHSPSLHSVVYNCYGVQTKDSMLILSHHTHRGGLEVLVVASLPAGAGLGSSAAYSVSLAAALLTHVRSLQPPTLVESTHSLAHPPEGILSKLIGGCGPVSVWGEEDLTTINKWGFEAERLIHGQPSGIDNSISTFGEPG